MIRDDPRIVGEQSCSGTFFRASRVLEDGSVLLGPSASSPAASVEELDRDAGGPTTYARRRLPGEPNFRPTQPASPSSIETLDRDSTSERARGRARRRLPGVLAMIALLTSGCATLSAPQAIEESGQRIEQARNAVEALAVVVATARSACEAAGDRAPEQCSLLADVPIDKARSALLDAAAAHQTAIDMLNALAPYAEAAHDVLEGAN